VSNQLGMTLDDCLNTITEKEYLVRLYWEDLNWNRPSKTDYYLMQIAREINRLVRCWSKGWKIPNLGDFKISFKTQMGEQVKPRSKEEATAIAKMTWAARLGLTSKKKK